MRIDAWKTVRHNSVRDPYVLGEVHFCGAFSPHEWDEMLAALMKIKHEGERRGDPAKSIQPDYEILPDGQLKPLSDRARLHG